MIRGRDHFSLAVRRHDGSISHTHGPLNPVFTGQIRRFPLLRGVLVLTETLMLGVKALNLSASMAISDHPKGSGEEMPGWVVGITLSISLALGIGIFFILPLLLVRAVDPFIASDVVSNVVEGLFRLAILVGYIWGIGFMKDIKRVFAYHGAEHMAVHTYEAGLPLNVDNVRKFGTPHPRCGTAFLLTVMLVSIAVFAFLGRPDLEWRILSRILLIPVIAGISYEIIRFSGAHQNWLIAQALAWPGLLLQRLTTRPPDDSQIEVAITAMETAIAADTGQEYAVWFPPRPVDTPDTTQPGEPVRGPEIDPQ